MRIMIHPPSPRLESEVYIMVFTCHLSSRGASSAWPQRYSIGKELTSTNALFNRAAYFKNDQGEEVERATQARTILICIDRSEDDAREINGPTTLTLLQALIQRAAPIITSIALLHNIFGRSQPSTSLPQPQASEKRDECMAWLYQEVIRSFKPQEWIISFTEDLSLCLLIPETYSNDHKNASDAIVQSNPTDPPVTFTAKELGLGIQFMPLIPQTPEGWLILLSDVTAIPDTEGATKLVPFLEQLFIEQNVYHHHEKLFVPQYTFYINGHGSKGDSIAGLSSDEFKKLLQFLASWVTTKLFLYDSCHASGYNRQLLYDEASFSARGTYPFPIISMGAADATTTFGWTCEVPATSTPPKRILDTLSFADLVKATEADDPVPYADITNVATSMHKITNAPLLRLPNREYFIPLESKFTIDISKTMALQKQLDLDAYGLQALAQYYGRPAHDPWIKEMAWQLYVRLMTTTMPPLVKFLRTGSRERTFEVISGIITKDNQPIVYNFNAVQTDYPLSTEPWKGSFWSIFAPINYAQDVIFAIKTLSSTASQGPQKLSNVIIEIRNKAATIYYTDEKGTHYTASGGHATATTEKDRYQETVRQKQEAEITEPGRLDIFKPVETRELEKVLRTKSGTIRNSTSLEQLHGKLQILSSVAKAS